jgi:hypothetical protein
VRDGDFAETCSWSACRISNLIKRTRTNRSLCASQKTRHVLHVSWPSSSVATHVMLQTCARDDTSIDARKLYDYLPEHGHSLDDSSSVNSAIYLLPIQMFRILGVYQRRDAETEEPCLDDSMWSDDSC